MISNTVERVSSSRSLRDHVEILEELSGPSSAGGKDKPRLQHRPSLLQALPDIAQGRIKTLS